MENQRSRSVSDIASATRRASFFFFERLLLQQTQHDTMTEGGCYMTSKVLLSLVSLSLPS